MSVVYLSQQKQVFVDLPNYIYKWLQDGREEQIWNLASTSSELGSQKIPKRRPFTVALGFISTLFA